MKTIHYIALLALLALFGIGGFFGAIEFAIEFSGIAYGLMKAALIVAVLWAVDKWLLHDFDTFEEIRNGNTSYAIVFGSVVLATALCIAGA
jgi:uncharacterized membrane protein YjfL (UPF0719 family)